MFSELLAKISFDAVWESVMGKRRTDQCDSSSLER